MDGENVSLENHSQVVRRIAGAGSTLREGLKKILKVRNFPYRLGRGGSKLVKFSPFLIFFNPSLSLLVVDTVCGAQSRHRWIIVGGGGGPPLEVGVRRSMSDTLIQPQLVF